MFGFWKKKNAAQSRVDAKNLVALVRPEVDALAARAAGPANKGLAEFYATLYFTWLVREKGDWKALAPYLPGAAADSLRVMRVGEKDRKKLERHIAGYWRETEQAEARLLRQDRNPLRWLEEPDSGFPGLALRDPSFSATVLTVTGDLVARLRLSAYKNRTITPPAPEGKAPEQKLPLSDIRPQSPRAPEYVTMTDREGKPVELRLLDVIVTTDGVFACLVAEGETELMVLKTSERPDGSTAYAPAEEKAARLVYAIFKTRNPWFFEE